MKRIMLAICAAVAPVSVGCSTPCVHTIWSADKAAKEPGLTGTWRQVEKDGSPSGTTYAIAPVDDEKSSLVVTAVEDGKERSWALEARTLDLGGERFADLTLDGKTRRELAERYGPLLLPTHVFVKYRLDGDTLTAWTMNGDWFRGVPADRGVPSTRWDSDGDLLTAETAKLQAFLASHAADAEAWEGGTVLKRSK